MVPVYPLRTTSLTTLSPKPLRVLLPENAAKSHSGQRPVLIHFPNTERDLLPAGHVQEAGLPKKGHHSAFLPDTATSQALVRSQDHSGTPSALTLTLILCLKLGPTPLCLAGPFPWPHNGLPAPNPLLPCTLSCHPAPACKAHPKCRLHYVTPCPEPSKGQ